APSSVHFFFQAEDGIRNRNLTGVQTCALPISQQERSSRPSTDGASASADQPDLGDARFAAEREALKAIVQFPYMAHAAVTELDDDDFTHPMTRLLWQHIQSGQLPSQPDSSWVPAIAESLPNDDSRRILRVCAVDPLNATVAETQRAV